MITLTQIQLRTIAQFIPNANGCNIDFTPFGEANNWECINDPILIPNEDTDYVHSSAIDLNYDLYLLPNHTTETGVINYVNIYARAKSDTIAQHQDGVYKIILTDNACGNIYKSSDIDLITGYATYNNIWLENPRTTAAWTWDDIDNLQIGVECSSPTLTGEAKILTLRPNAAGDSSQFNRNNCTANWRCVDEIIPDNNTTFLNPNVFSAWRKDLFNITNHTVENGVISKIAIFAYLAWENLIGDEPEAKIGLKTGGAEDWRNTFKISDLNYQYYSEEWLLNPTTGLAWTWADIDALQIGLQGYRQAGSADLHNTQMYVIVYYNENVNPEIRTTQCYAEINYDAEIDCLLNNPEKTSQNQSQAIKMLNFWDGSREVYGISRGNKTSVIQGKEWDTSGIIACERMKCIEGMGKNGSPLTVSGINWLFDREYRIASFGWKKISDKPKLFEWILELEHTE